MRAKVKHGMRFEIFAQIAVESREGVRGCQAFFKQQAHRVAFVTKRRLHADQHIAKLLAQHKDRAAVTQLTTGGRAPLGLNFFKPALTLHVIVGRN